MHCTLLLITRLQHLGRSRISNQATLVCTIMNGGCCKRIQVHKALTSSPKSHLTGSTSGSTRVRTIQTTRWQQALTKPKSGSAPHLVAQLILPLPTKNTLCMLRMRHLFLTRSRQCLQDTRNLPSMTAARSFPFLGHHSCTLL